MKNTLLIFAILPFAAFAQHVPKQGDADHKATVIHYKKMSVQYGETVYKDKHYNATNKWDDPGDFIFAKKNKPNDYKVVFADTTDDTNLGVYTIIKPEIECLAFPKLKGDMLVYNNKTNLATLTGHICMTKNGTEKEVAKIAVLDLSGDCYKVMCMK